MSTRRKKIYRIVALYLAFNLLAQICMPTAAFALTNGPGQPEFESFEPAGTTDMVNLFTGDFNYNIPLMTVPGPNGGYPINMAYHAGIGMEQEASWVGLGWNINAGAINRSMRGLPDDFNGEKVTKTLHYKPATSFSFKAGTSLSALDVNHEIMGFDASGSSASMEIYYNNYRGLGYRFGLSLADNSATHASGSKASPFKINLTSSADGIGVNVDYNYLWKKETESKSQNWGLKSGLSWGSRDGITSISLSGGYERKWRTDYGAQNFGAGVSFAKSNYVPTSTPQMAGFIAMLGIKIGEDNKMVWKSKKPFTLDASYVRSWVKDTSEYLNSFGYLNNENSEAIYDQNILEDINYEKDIAPSRQSKTIAVPVPTYDIYNVSGQGVGGVFRPYRSDIGIYTEPKITSTIRGGDASAEFGTPHVATSYLKWGADAAYEQSQTYSGMWFNHWFLGNNGNQGWNSLKDYEFQKLDASGALSGDNSYEPFYFKMSGEQTATPVDQLDFIGGDVPVRFQLNEIFGDDNGINVRPEISTDKLYADDLNLIGGSPIDLNNSKNHRSFREKKVVSNQYRTNAELDAFASSTPTNIYSSLNSFPATGGISSPSAYNYSAHTSNQIGEFTEVNPDGNRYVYGIPVYTNKTKEARFSLNGLNTYNKDYLHSFSSDQASAKNEEANTDQFFSSTIIPEYAETYLLTAIYSPDYVDVTGNGPTNDDLGYFVKFNYEKANSSYKWRAPYDSAIVSEGYLSDLQDDKLSYEYGEKEIYYLHSIETKTHVACFFLKDVANGRDDGRAAYSECPSTLSTRVLSSSKLWALDHVALYSKADPNYGSTNAVPLKSVYFNYDYSLCPKVYNNINTESKLGNNDGKLTLKSIYFTYCNNNKGHLSPYQFEYLDNSYAAELVNPEYDPNSNDRWGNYSRQDATKFLNKENPYVNQKTTQRTKVDQSAAAWCLKKIVLPSGSKISINYEADDYAYVQDKPAMQMCRVIGTGLQDLPSLPNNNTLSDVSTSLSRFNDRIYFELNTPIYNYLGLSPSDKEAIVKKYISGIEDMYFKMFVSLKQEYVSVHRAADYVEGYCKISQTIGTYGVVDEGAGNDNHYGFLTIEPVAMDDYGAALLNANPIQKAAWQYIYLDRPDLFAPYDLSTSEFSNLVGTASAMLTDVQRSVAPYKTAFAKGWAFNLHLDDPNSSDDKDKRPSYIRLNSPDGIKVGGGHRVKSITTSDVWNDLSNSGSNADYGQQYIYRLADGKSSGVASYEPMVGGEEIPQRLPIKYSSNSLVKQDDAFYVNEPMGESYFPAPIVGYSRVIVKSIVGNNNLDENSSEITQSRSGQTVYEFYTSKDYPVIAKRTNLQKTWFPIPIIIPNVLKLNYNNRGFSQGYSVVLNDMHGKLKSVSTYSSVIDLTSSNPLPTRRAVYKYKTVDDGDHANEISSKVNVLTADGKYEEANLGETYDFFFDMRQQSNETEELGLQFNGELNVISHVIIPNVIPLINISRALYRSAVTMKVIYRTGILTDVETLDDGVKSSAHNLMFDAETGAPLLTTITNEFEKPVYTYNYSAHWDYDGMKGAYNNVGERFGSVATNSSGVATITNASSYFFPGDEVMYLPTSGTAHMLWVKSTSGNTVTFMDADGSSTAADVASLGSATLVISRSGHRNQQSVSNGTIVSLSNPVTDRNFPLFDALNALSTLSESTVYSFVDCASGTTIYFKLSFVDDVLSITECTAEGVAQECHATITFPPLSGYESISDLNACNFTKAGNSVIVDFPTGPDVTATWADQNHCFNECLDNVLHAAAVRFTDDWSTSTVGHGQAINFADVGLPTPGAGYNKYVFATNGVWRTQSNYLYQVDRKQTTTSTSSTDISKDGTYKNFVLYDWLTAPQNNNRWSYVSQVTRYSPYGYALESRDALGIYSATMFGYANTKQTASAANCQYFEMGYDGFEDYPSAAYPENLGTSLWGHGHLYFEPANEDAPPLLSTNHAHTGKYGLVVDATDNAEFQTTATGSPYSSTQQYFAPQAGQDYFLSVWVWNDPNAVPSVEIDNGSSTTYTTDNAVSPIEGWKQINVRFTAPAAGNALTIKLKCQTGVAYFDDIRVQPFKSAMSSNVYDPQTHWLIAELDNRNFATFYNYDSEGSLVQVKQETEKGIFTVQTSRSNIKR